ncbi:MAG: sigma-54 dependent transcriptional regulator [Vicinamibacteria bacterium]
MRILIADDEPEICRFISDLIRGDDRDVVTATSVENAVESHRRAPCDIVISDINFNTTLTGLDLLRSVRTGAHGPEVVLMSGFGTLETAVEAVRAGAFDYVSKPFDINEVRSTVDRAIRQRVATLNEPEAPLLQTSASQTRSPPALVGRNRLMLAVYKQIALSAPSHASVLIIGETGTGKELAARAIHRHSTRSQMPFVAVNCGALNEGVLESELFGHVRGSFTGAMSDKKGLFEQAHGGTLFLDEIGEMPVALQVKLLRALQEGEVRPVGGAKPVSVDVRVVSATHRDLDKSAEAGTFRSDLLYRLKVVEIRLPALRERPDDVPLLVESFLARFPRADGTRAVVTSRALAKLAAYPWPGNVRELEHVVERLVLTSPGRRIDAEDLPAEVQPSPASWSQQTFDDLPPLDELEKRYLQHVMSVLKGNKKRTAEVMGIDRRTLYRMAERFGLTWDDKDDAP